MAEKYVLSPALTVGDLDRQITIDELLPVSLSFNFEAVYSGRGVAVLSVGLQHPASGYRFTVLYEDISALQLWTSADKTDFRTKSLTRVILEKLVADGKLPPGEIITF